MLGSCSRARSFSYTHSFVQFALFLWLRRSFRAQLYARFACGFFSVYTSPFLCVTSGAHVTWQCQGGDGVADQDFRVLKGNHKCKLYRELWRKNHESRKYTIRCVPISLIHEIQNVLGSLRLQLTTHDCCVLDVAR